ncbi:PPC domain-containing DNA-binding protein [Piscinibacter defluvii]|uniref:PPC domain-containing DNA-binding protein n=1 Tax=Piscinibacter defluvii TaxID=1796922 RepID=UPI000FDF2D61|nr:PPC domain-containing DNA-binding protein [Piscinibacter defluvii]
MSYLPIRLAPGVDLRRALEEKASQLPTKSAFVFAGIGSLSAVSIRFAAAERETLLSGSFELVTLSGTLSAAGAHLHMSVSSESGQVVGGHVGYGNVVRTTAEVLLVSLEGWSLTRARDPATGYQELQVKPASGGTSAA